MEQTAQWYDRFFITHQGYHGSAESMMYHDLWIKVRNMLPQGSSLLDIGCGTGQFAQVLHDRPDLTYTGIDFSRVAIDIANSWHHNCTCTFQCVNAHEYPLTDHPLPMWITMIEFLEHIRDDLALVRKIPLRVRVIFTVPSYESPVHCRVFKTSTEVRDRYNALFTDLTVSEHIYSDSHKIWICGGTRNDKLGLGMRPKQATGTLRTGSTTISGN